MKKTLLQKKSLARSPMILTSIISLTSFLSSQAAITVDITDDGMNTSIVIRGSIDPSGLTPSPDGRSTIIPVGFLTGVANSQRINPGLSPTFGSPGIATNFYSGTTPSMVAFTTSNVQSTALASLPMIWMISGASANGGSILVADELLTLGGTGLTYSANISGTLSSLGFIDGVVSSTSWTTTSNVTESITFRTGSAVVVPEPASASLLICGLLTLTLRRKRSSNSSRS
ncbi:MAG: PEP-CTERM sorting domain-containing protein [Maribacter stanieri]